MDRELPDKQATQYPVAGFVQTAFQQERPSGLTTILKCITETVDAFACILWQLARNERVAMEPPLGHLYVVAEWVQKHGRICSIHNLSLTDSATGKAVINQKPVAVDDISTDNRVRNRDHWFYQQNNIRTLCVVPLIFLDNTKGALTVYRNVGSPFRPEEQDLLQQMAELVPNLCEGIINKVGFDLLRTIDEILHRAECDPVPTFLEKATQKQVIRSICEQVSRTLECLQCSVYLEDRLQIPTRHELMGTTDPLFVDTASYMKGIDKGTITEYPLLEGKPILIFDLKEYEPEHKEAWKEYPGREWKGARGIKEKLCAKWQLTQNELPPLSFIGAPILMGNTVLGVIRCSIADYESCRPHHFASRELELLELVAARLSSYWINWLDRHGAHATLKAKAAELEAIQKARNLTFQNLRHQLETPILSAQRRSQFILSGEGTDAELRRDLFAIRGQCRKAVLVVNTIGHLADLSSGESIKPNLAPLNLNELVKTLIEAAQDHEIISQGQDEQVKFSVVKETFERLIPGLQNKVYVEGALLGQAVNCLLDNAGKYSYQNSTVWITGGQTKKGRFYISVINKGLRIRPEEVEKCKQMGGRGDDAPNWGLGKGLGLWIVNHIMLAHGGDLEIVPTATRPLEWLTYRGTEPKTMARVSEVKLILPVLGV